MKPENIRKEEKAKKGIQIKTKTDTIKEYLNNSNTMNIYTIESMVT